MNTELLLKYIDGDATDQEKESIILWIDSDPENLKEYLALRKLHDITLWQTVPVNQAEKKPKERVTLWKLRPIYTEVLKIAAVFLIAILIYRNFHPEHKLSTQVVMQTVHVPAGQRAEITLVDGTKVWLNAKTTLTFPNRFIGLNREVRLEGEGFFDVTSNKTNPFIVKTKKYDIKVWGTRFNLMAYSEKNIFQASLLEGSVEIIEPGSCKGVFIKPQEQISQSNDHLEIAPIMDANHFLWKEGIISFNDASFPDLINKLELYFDINIDIKNDKILNYRCTGKFRTKDGVEHILRVLQLNKKFNFKIDEKTNRIIIN